MDFWKVMNVQQKYISSIYNGLFEMIYDSVVFRYILLELSLGHEKTKKFEIRVNNMLRSIAIYY